MKKIFIGCPISKYLDGNSFTNDDFKNFIEELHLLCKKYSDTVFLALEREAFGVKRMEDDLCTRLDFEEMKDTDLFISIPEDSLGVAVETGWASAMQKNIILILDEEYRYSPLIKSIGVVTNAETIEINTANGYSTCKADFFRALENKLINFTSSSMIEDAKVS